MSGKEDARIFVGGLSWQTSDRELEDAFSRFGKVIEAQIMTERDTGRPRGFGFVTFADRRAMEDAIADMHGRDLGGRNISVNKAEPKMGSDDAGYGYSNSGRYSPRGRGSYRGGGGRDVPPPVNSSDCFKCGRPGHWARECPSAGGGGGGGKFSSRSRGDRFGGGDRYGDRYEDDRYDGGRYGDRDRVESRDGGRYGGSGRDRYASDRYGGDRYPPSGDRYYGGGGGGDRYGGGADRYPQNGYGKERSYDRDAPRGGGSDRYGGGGPAPARYGGGGGGGSYRERSGPYERPSRGGRPSSYDR